MLPLPIVTKVVLQCRVQSVGSSRVVGICIGDLSYVACHSICVCVCVALYKVLFVQEFYFFVYHRICGSFV